MDLKSQLFELADGHGPRMFGLSDAATLAPLVRRIFRSLPHCRSSVMHTAICMLDKKMTEKYSITEARRNLPRLIREAEHGKTMELTRRGETVAVLVGHRKFERLAAGRRSFAKAFREFKTTVDLVKLNLNPDEIFAGVRDTTPGRQVRF